MEDTSRAKPVRSRFVKKWPNSVKREAASNCNGIGLDPTIVQGCAVNGGRGRKAKQFTRSEATPVRQANLRPGR